MDDLFDGVDGVEPDLPEPIAAPRATAPIDQREWTREPICDCGAAAYTILIRAPGDLERRSREDRHEAMGVTAAALEWKTLRKASVETWAARFLDLLADGAPRTLNAMAVVLTDQTADIVGDNAIAALWALKEAGILEHTVDAPVLWRIVEQIANPDPNVGDLAEMERAA